MFSERSPCIYLQCNTGMTTVSIEGLEQTNLQSGQTRLMNTLKNPSNGPKTLAATLPNVAGLDRATTMSSHTWHNAFLSR